MRCPPQPPRSLAAPWGCCCGPLEALPDAQLVILDLSVAGCDAACITNVQSPRALRFGVRTWYCTKCVCFGLLLRLCVFLCESILECLYSSFCCADTRWNTVSSYPIYPASIHSAPY